MALFILAAFAVVFALDWAQSFVVSLLLGILFAYTLNPLVAWLERLRIPRLAGTGVVMTGIVCAIVLGTNSLSGQIQTILDQVPEAVGRLSVGIAKLRQGETSTMQKMQAAASQIEKATSEAAGLASPPKQRVTRVVIDTPGFKLGNFLWANSMGAAALIGQASMVFFLTFFLLLSGDSYKRKLVRLAGPSLSQRKVTVRILDDIDESIQRYMFMLLVTNLLVALLTWIALSWLGLENAGAWAVAAGLLHLVPYLGPIVTAVVIGMAAFMQFDTLSMMLLAGGTSLAIATVVGHFVTTWMTGRIARMNTAAVFVSLLFWAWLWGVWGMLLSIPIIVIVKVVAQHVEQFGAVAELLGD
ncbi:AI-2E family transporter [Sulfurisoma sediminicola]|uniref:Putative PurR-regulated permease PerM n=1 Tax=Sulfurisoma sediminicola TaxID=1381557 RepID=A0A497XKW0_9PROT|nr:AI-2E family transporter [Sulfurisoma sediminicola]RLJ68591.1 putative PurR-regulated permease PerM [Sulfurisoma sediminicola]